MHWLLIYALHFGKNDLQVKQLPFPTKKECVSAGNQITSGFTTLWTKAFNAVNYVCIPYETKESSCTGS